MKLTKNILKQLIREELDKVYTEKLDSKEKAEKKKLQKKEDGDEANEREKLNNLGFYNFKVLANFTSKLTYN